MGISPLRFCSPVAIRALGNNFGVSESVRIHLETFSRKGSDSESLAEQY